MKKLALFSATSAILMIAAATPAYAAVAVPGPEAGIGLVAMGLIGGGYAYMRRRFNRR